MTDSSTSGSAGTSGGFPVLALPPVVGAALLVLYVIILLVKRLVDNCRFSVEKTRTDLLGKRLKEILKNLPSAMDKTNAQKSGCFPCLKKRNTKAAPTSSPLTTLNEFGEAQDADADEVPSTTLNEFDEAKDADADKVLKKKLLVSTVVKELQDIIRVLARILAARRKVSEWKIPLLKWNGRDYLLSVISPDSTVDLAESNHLVSVPLSISHIQKKLREKRDEEASEGAQLAVAAQLQMAAFEGAQLAIVYKAIQVVQAKSVTQWNISLQILKTTTYAFVTLLGFYYTGYTSAGTNAIAFLAVYVLADMISNVSTTSVVDFVIPRLSAEMDNLVREIELRLERMALNKEQEVNDWLKVYFDKYNKMQQLLRDDHSAYRGRSIEKAGYQLVNALS